MKKRLIAGQTCLFSLPSSLVTAFPDSPGFFFEDLSDEVSWEEVRLVRLLGPKVSGTVLKSCPQSVRLVSSKKTTLVSYACNNVTKGLNDQDFRKLLREKEIFIMDTIFFDKVSLSAVTRIVGLFFSRLPLSRC